MALSQHAAASQEAQAGRRLAEALERVDSPGGLVLAVVDSLGVPPEVAEWALDEALDELDENLLSFGLAAGGAAAASAARRAAHNDPMFSDKWKRRTRLHDLKVRGRKKADREGRKLARSGKPPRDEAGAGKILKRYGRFKRHMAVKGAVSRASELAGRVSSAAKRGMKMVFGKWQKLKAKRQAESWRELGHELRRMESYASPFPEIRARRIEEVRALLEKRRA